MTDDEGYIRTLCGILDPALVIKALEQYLSVEDILRYKAEGRHIAAITNEMQERMRKFRENKNTY